VDRAACTARPSAYAPLTATFGTGSGVAPVPLLGGVDKPNPKHEITNIASLLWTDEATRLLENHNLIEGNKSKPPIDPQVAIAPNIEISVVKD